MKVKKPAKLKQNKKRANKVKKKFNHEKKSGTLKVKLSKVNDLPEEQQNAVCIQANTEMLSKAPVKLLTEEEIVAKYPVLADKELIQRFLNVPLTNNQKGRVRQNLKDSLQNASEDLIPDIVHGKIQTILESSDLSESELRKVRILHNMLRTAVKAENLDKSIKNETKKNKNKLKKKNKKKKQSSLSDKIDKNDKTIQSTITDKPEECLNDTVSEKEDSENKDGAIKDETEKGTKEQDKKKYKHKRYIVFIGNLPKDINEDVIKSHFKEISNSILDVRLPKKDDAKASIAYVELKDDFSYEFALSRHHSMLGNRRINVLYTTGKDTKLEKREVKGKAAKLVALRDSGSLIGSGPMNRKRSFRRKKKREAEKREKDLKGIE